MSREELKKKAPWFMTRLRVRYQETDQMAVVYHANYLTWFEMGRTNMIRELGFSYFEMEEQGVMLPVIDANLSFRQPAHYDDEIVVYTRMTAFSKLRIEYEYEVRRFSGSLPEGPLVLGQDGDQELLGELLVIGSTKHVWVGKNDWRPVRLDKTVPKLYNALEGKLRTWN